MIHLHTFGEAGRRPIKAITALCHPSSKPIHLTASRGENHFLFMRSKPQKIDWFPFQHLHNQKRSVRTQKVFHTSSKSAKRYAFFFWMWFEDETRKGLGVNWALLGSFHDLLSVPVLRNGSHLGYGRLLFLLSPFGRHPCVVGIPAIQKQSHLAPHQRAAR